MAPYRKTKKAIETEKWVDEYIIKNGMPPTYLEIEQQFKVSSSSAHFRCRTFRYKMRQNNVTRKPENSKVCLFFDVPYDKMEVFTKLIQPIYKLLENP